MNQLVSIKGNRYGIAVRMDASAPFEKILEDAGRAFSEAADFFRDARMAVSFQGRELTPDQEGQLLEQYARSATTPPRVAEQEPLEQEEDSLPGNEELYRMDEQSASAANPGQFYKGTLRSGQVVESDSSIIVLGDINPGATVIAKGNVVVLGSLKGNAHAGSNGNTTAFVVALEMQPMQIRIGDVMGRCADGVSKRGTKPTGPQIAFVENENIYVESISRDIMNEINFQ